MVLHIAMNYLLLLGWGVCLCFAFIGWGNLLLRLCHLRQAGWPLSGGVGVALLTAVGGVLNLLHLLLPLLWVGIIVAGDLLAALLLRPRLGQLLELPRRSLWLGLLLIVVIAVPVLGNVQADLRSFNINDDLPAYLALPAETLQLNTLPFDPFNERRVTSSLGASYVLQSLPLLPTHDIRSLRMIDVSVGTLLFAGLLITIFRRLGVPLTQALALSLLIFAVPVIRLNATFVVLPAALFCALFLLQMVPGAATRLGTSLLLALVSAALCAIKSNYLPPAILICALFYGGNLLRTRRGVTAMAALLWAALTCAFLAPWMLDMHNKEGTYLFPLLGRGYDASAYGVIPLPNGSHISVSSGAIWVWLTVLPMAGPLLVALLTLVAAYRKRLDAELAVALGALLLGSVLSIFAIASSTAGESLGRYSLPFQLPALLIFFAWLLQWPRRSGVSVFWWRPMAILTVLCLASLALLFGVRHSEYRRYLEDARLLTPPGESWFDAGLEVKREQALQAAIPPGERLLARLFVSYGLDFKRNQIFLPDYTGMAGFPPGMPIDGSLSVLSRYLDRNNIHYLAYDYRRTMRDDYDPATTLTEVLRNPARYGRHGWLYIQMKVSHFEQQQVARLAQICPHVYDDGTVYVLHVSSHSSNDYSAMSTSDLSQ